MTSVCMTSAVDADDNDDRPCREAWSQVCWRGDSGLLAFCVSTALAKFLSPVSLISPVLHNSVTPVSNASIL